MAKKITIDSIDNYESEATITFDAADFEKTKSRACKQLAGRVTIPGFRKGKVPPAKILEQYLGKGAIVDEVKEILIREGANEILKTMKHMPVTEMKPEIISSADGKDFVFKLTYTPYPEVELGEYKGLKVDKVVEPVTDEDVEHQIGHILDNNANMVEAEEGAEVADGDFITLDYVGTVNGEKFEGGEGKDQPLVIGSHRFIDNFEEQLIGMKVGEERDVKVTFPEGYHAKDLAEKPAVFHCKINSIKHKNIPELDLDFLKKINSKFETVEAFKENVRKTLEAQAERDALTKQREAVVQMAIDNMKVDIPPVMIDTRVEQMINEFEARLQAQGLNMEVFFAGSGKTVDDLRESYRDDAKQSLLIDLLLEEISIVEKISVSDADVNREISAMSSMYHMTPKQVVKALQENGQIQTVLSNIRHQNAMRFIFDNMAKDEVAEEVSTDTVEEKTADEEKVADKKVADVADVEKVTEEKSATVEEKTVEEKSADVDEEKSSAELDKSANS